MHLNIELDNGELAVLLQFVAKGIRDVHSSSAKKYLLDLYKKINEGVSNEAPKSVQPMIPKSGGGLQEEFIV